MPDPIAAPCPDENTVAMFVRGELAGAEASAIEAHIDGCGACAQVVVEAARLFGESPSRVAATAGATLISGVTTRGQDDWLAPGDRVGRYRVLEPIGAGGMGVVYAAYDPELDRRVALKLLHERGDAGSEGRSRLLREAQALARLSHPNVVAIHDVGTLGQRLFLAMEFVDGTTLRRWLAEHPRSWPQIRDVFVAAGRGLAAAHAAGLVHRDFKPDNVLIDRDGRVRVTDFGLARISGEVREISEHDTTDHDHGATADALTQTGAIVGTPAYMAPEQFDGGTVDAASDQYSFCVALYEALWRTRPHEAKSLHELMVAVQTEAPREPPRDPRVPTAAREAILRGLARDRAHRFADMAALLAILQRDPGRARRQALLLTLPVAAIAVGAASWANRGDDGPEFCRSDPMAQVWGGEQREQARTWFTSAALPYGEQTAASFERTLDAYAGRFAELRERACTPRSDRDAAPGIDALRMLCLEERRAHLQATLGVLAESATGDRGKTLLARAPMIAESLPSLEACDDVGRSAALRGEQVPPVLASAVIDARARLAEVSSISLGGDYADALARVDGLVDEIESLQFDPLTAELRLVRGRVLTLLARFDESRAELERATELATRSGDRVTNAAALIELVYVFGQSGNHVELGDFAAHQANAEIAGVGAPARLSARLHKNLGNLRLQAGRTDDALNELGAALALAGPDDAPLFRIELLLDLAKVEVTALRFDDAAMHMEECRGLVAAGLGKQHPAMADVEFAEGLLHVAQLRWDPALAAFERALEIRRAALGERHPDYANDLAVVGDVLAMQGQHERGIANLREATAVYGAAVGPDHIMTLNVGMRLAHALMQAGRAEEAAEQAAAVLERTKRVLAPSHPSVPAGLGVLATAQLALHRFDDAIATRREALDLTVTAYGEGHVYTAIAHGELGEALLAGGQARAAVASLQRAIELAGDDELVGSERAWFTYLLVRTRLELGEREPGARARIDAAIARLELGSDPRADEVRTWSTSAGLE